MKRFLTAVAFVMAILTVGSSAWALSYNDHVSVAPNGQGDLLIFPVYVSAQGWVSDLTIINTSSRSVVAKLVVRSWVFSEELLDFLIYLSPYDMWIGKIQYGANGPEMYSTDSSALYTDIDGSSTPFATETNPLRKTLVTTACTQDSNQIGYVEVIEAWSGNLTLDADKQKRGRAIYNAYVQAPTPTPADTVNALAASLNVKYPALDWDASMEAVVLKNYDNLTKLTTSVTTGIGLGANNNLLEIEAALSKNFIALPFLNNTTDGASIHGITFPTKISTWDASKTPCAYSGSPSGYFATSQKQIYSIRAFDNEEQTTGSPFSPARSLTLPNEVNLIGVSDLVFKLGWLEMTLANPRVTGLTNVAGQVLNYTGAPAIPFIFDISGGGLSLRYVSYQDGVVTGTPGTLGTYQYSTAYVATQGS